MAMGNEFKARSGRVVKPAEDGSIRFELAHGYLSRETAFDAEEFFLAKRDAELGRWRSRFDPMYIVYPDGAGFRVMNEQDGTSSGIITLETVFGFTGRTYQVASEYLNAHPARKPWHDAQHGEVWAVTHTGGQTDLCRVTSFGRFEQVSGTDALVSMPVTHASITAAGRVWPEVAS